MTRDGQRSPESHQNHPGALTPSISHLEQPLERPQASTRIPPSPGDGAGTGGAAAFGSPEGREEEDVPTWMRSWLLPVPWEGGRAPCSPQELETPNPGAGGSFPDLLDLYEAPEALEKEDAPRAGALPGEALLEIRGPVKVIWEAGREFGPCWSWCPVHQGHFTFLSISPGHTGAVPEWGYCLKNLWAPDFVVPGRIGHRKASEVWLCRQDIPPVILTEALSWGKSSLNLLCIFQLNSSEAFPSFSLMATPQNVFPNHSKGFPSF